MKRDNIFLLTSKLAWRNIWRNKRRTILTLFTIYFGCSSIIFNNAVGKGMYDQMIVNAASGNIGHIQVHAKDFWENRGIEYAFIPEKKMIDAIEKDQDIEGYSKRIHADGLISFNDITSGVMIQGIDPVKDKTVSDIYKSILPGGRFLQSGDMKKIVIGKILAKRIGAKIGDKAALLSQGLDGSIAAENLTVVGIFKTDNMEYDGSLIIMPIDQAALTFSMNESINSIVIKLKRIDTAYDVRDRLLKNINGSKLEVLAWKELMPDIVQNITLDNIFRKIFDLVLFIVVSFSILNTIQMSVFNRIREFGVMLALGTGQRQIITMVLFESLYITFIGVILGGIGASLITWHFYINPINFARFSKEAVDAAVLAQHPLIMRTDMSLFNLFVNSLLIIVLSIVFSIIPARKAAGLRPVQAIRHL